MQISANSSITVPRSSQRVIAIAAVVHASLVTGWWWASIYADIDIPIVNGRIWFVAAWAWLAWPIYVLARAKATRFTVAALVFGAVVIAPAVPTIYTFTVWSIGGFAP
jgi:hypothetical protein